MKHKYLAVLVTLPMLTFSAVPAFAATAANTDTGAYSENQTHVVIRNTTTVENRNTGTANNDIDVHLSTGNNTVEGNTGHAILGHDGRSDSFEDSRSGSIKTGDADAKIDVVNKFNTNTTVVCQEKCDFEKVSPEEGKGGGPAEEAVTPTAEESAGVSPAEGAAAPTELAAAGANSALMAVPLALGTLAMLYLARLRKRTFIS